MKQLPLRLGIAICGLILLDHFLLINLLRNLSKEILDYAAIVTAFAMGLGFVSLSIRHYKAIKARREGWLYSTILVMGLLSFPVATFLFGGLRGRLGMWIYDNIYGSINATFYSIQMFYVCSGSYRVFRVKSTQAVVLGIAAMLVVFGRTPALEGLWAGFPNLADWLWKVPGGGAQRGIVIGTGVGTMAAGVRYLLGIERSSTQ